MSNKQLTHAPTYLCSATILFSKASLKKAHPGISTVMSDTIG
ncbi:MAG: hypothetical protein PF444_04485 [Bacteroidales bacterium]|nr:hypothetical protein [Bacteroidales bacterium]